MSSAIIMTIMLMLLLLLLLLMPLTRRIMMTMMKFMMTVAMPAMILSLINSKRPLTSAHMFPQFRWLDNICCGFSGLTTCRGRRCQWWSKGLTWLITLYALLWHGLTTTKLTLVEAGSHIRLTQRNNHANISELLDNLLRGYDNSIRPDFGGPPATVEVDIMVRSMGPISEVDMTYSMDCYFRQSWVDKRLAFKGAQATLALSVSMLARIWKPDTYFYNGKQSYLHTITTPNKFVRIHQNGRVLYSSRLTIKAGCPMNLEDFPMDIQKCPLKFGSFGYTTADVIYRWNKERPAVAIAEDMKLSQFDLVDCPAGNLTDVVYKASSPYHENARNYAGGGGFGGQTTTTHQVHHSTHQHQKQQRQHQTEQHQHGHHHNNNNNYDDNNSNYNQFSNRGNKTLTTFAGPGAKNQHVRGTGIQLDKASSFGVGGGAGGGHIRLESDQSSEYSMLMVNFHLQRHMGNFLIQVYGPCCLLVVLSWVSFWLNREATADRVSLGITTVLTMTFLGLEARTDLPKVPYPTALDFFVFLSFAFIFATILQFAVVHYFTKYGSGECYFIIEELDSDTETECAVRQTHKLGMTPEYEDTNSSTETKIYEVIPLSMCSINIPKGGSSMKNRRSRERKYRRQSAWWNCWNQVQSWLGCRQKRGRHKAHFGSSDEDGEEIHLRAHEDVTPKKYSGRRRMSYYRREELDARRKGKRTPQYNSVSKIDRASRIVFPILFLLINVFYWYGYLSRSSRILAHSNSTT